ARRDVRESRVPSRTGRALLHVARAPQLLLVPTREGDASDHGPDPAGCGRGSGGGSAHTGRPRLARPDPGSHAPAAGKRDPAAVPEETALVPGPRAEPARDAHRRLDPARYRGVDH